MKAPCFVSLETDVVPLADVPGPAVRLLEMPEGFGEGLADRHPPDGDICAGKGGFAGVNSQSRK
jgi:hypothetical protein